MTPVVVFTPWGSVIAHTEHELLVLGRLCGGLLRVSALRPTQQVGG